ncbi:MAG: sensor histidine kinase [Gammaproteobacteria bacterium]
MNTQNEPAGNTQSLSKLAGSVAMGATFNLIYLVFLFFPWMFKGPATIDMLVGAVALVIFIPIHYYAFNASSEERILPVAVVALLGAACNFFLLGAGVFQIYCGAMTGFCRPVLRSAIVLGLCTVVYVVSAVVAQRTLTEMGFVLFMSIIVWFSTISTSQGFLDMAQIEREQELDRQAASLFERERIGRDLHDLLGHTLTMVALKSDLANRLIDTDPDKAKEQIEEIQVGARRALSDVRLALSGLARVSVVAELENGRKALESASVALSVTGHVPDLSPEQDQVLGMMIREAVTNIIRHTLATEVRIEFFITDKEQRLSISDNGGGKVNTEGRGLSGLRKRIESVGGSVWIDDKSDGEARASGEDGAEHFEGVRVQATLPVASA